MEEGMEEGMEEKMEEKRGTWGGHVTNLQRSADDKAEIAELDLGSLAVVACVCCRRGPGGGEWWW
jgi:hypothetical protein